MYGTRCWPGVVQGIHCVLSWENLKVFDIKSQVFDHYVSLWGMIRYIRYRVKCIYSSLIPMTKSESGSFWSIFPDIILILLFTKKMKDFRRRKYTASKGGCTDILKRLKRILIKVERFVRGKEENTQTGYHSLSTSNYSCNASAWMASGLLWWSINGVSNVTNHNFFSYVVE